MAQVYANILESLTSGLYNEINFAVREYLQNGYDAIKEAKKVGLHEPNEGYCINVQITNDNSIITITDNGIGMNEQILKEYSSIGGGTKLDPDLTGHKGIGKLSGLRFFKYFIVKTKIAGSQIGHELVWDSGNMMRALISNQEKMKRTPYVDFIKDYVKINNFDCSDREMEHYTQVQLIDVLDEFRSQLTELEIGSYIKKAFPVPFYSDEFKFAENINKWFGDELVPIQTYINDKVIYQFYRNSDNLVNPKKYTVKYDDKLRAKAWISWISGKSETIPKSEIQGIKFRCKGICVGDSNLFANNCMPSGRGAISKWFTGEIVLIDDDIKPSAARDRFYEGAKSKKFYDQIKKIIGKDLSIIADIRSEISAAQQDVEKWKENVIKQKGSFFKNIEKRLRRLRKHKTRNIYDFDFSIIDKLQNILTSHENKIINEDPKDHNEIDNLIKNGNKSELVKKFETLVKEKMDTPSKKAKKLLDKQIQKISKELSFSKPIDENNEDTYIRKTYEIISKYLEKYSIDYDKSEVLEFIKCEW